ncbi:MAG: hypothetical protein OEZ01_17525, partial [Candidatus Heimdallarchaeota archaeon]|nr:hypothetical protein [Candidatus Heimdallarchaeota archaeon]
LIVLILFFSVSFNSQLVFSVPGDSFDDPITAVIGNNTGTISGVDPIYYWFDGTGTYIFTLNGDVETQFHLDIYTGDRVRMIYNGVSYPIVERATSANGFYLKVIPYSGTGDYTLTIDDTPDVVSNAYFDGFQQGDVLEWSTEDYDGNHISNISIEILTPNTINIISSQEDLFRTNFTTITGFLTITGDEPGNNLIYPTIINFDDHSQMDFETYFTLFFENVFHDLECSETECVLSETTGDTTFDKMTGIVTYLDDTLSSKIYTLETNLDEFLGNNIDNNNNSSSSTPAGTDDNSVNDDKLTFNPIFGIILFSLPIFNKLKKTKIRN